MIRKNMRKTRKIFWLFLIPLLLILLVQSALTYGSVILSGTFSMLQDYSINRLEQVTETRKAIFEGNMSMQWTAFSEEYGIANQHLIQVLKDSGASLDEFLRDDTLQKDYLSALMSRWCQLMRTNGTTGAFLILAAPDALDKGGALNAVYVRDSDPKVNPVAFTDMLLVRGDSAAAKQHGIAFDSLWQSKLQMEPAGKRRADDFFFAPFEQALRNKASDPRDLAYWSPLFCLESNEKSDAYRMITYSLPLISEQGQVYGVMGIELSESYLNDLLPYREIDAEKEGGYILLERSSGLSYSPIFVTGPVATHAVGELETLHLRETGHENFFELNSAESSKRLYLSIKPLNMYNPNTPFSHRGWYLAGVETHHTLFGVGALLAKVFSLATVIALVIGIIAIYLTVIHVTKPIRRLSGCMQENTSRGLMAFERSYITEVDDLYDTICALTAKQKQAAYDLMQEKERYRVALQSSTDILITYDLKPDCATLYNLGGQDADNVIYYFLSQLGHSGYVHTEDVPRVRQALGTPRGEVKLSFRADWSHSAHEYRWCELRGRFLPGENGFSKILIGSMRDIHEQKEKEIKLFEALHNDSLTGLSCYAVGETTVRKRVEAGETGCLVLMDIHQFFRINEQFGMVVGDVVLEELGNLLLTWAQKQNTPHILVARMGGDEFLLWLEHFDQAAASAAVEELMVLAGKLYASGGFSLRLSVGGAMSRGQPFDLLLCQAQLSLGHSKAQASGFILYEHLPDDGRQMVSMPTVIVIDDIEHTAAASTNIISLAFNFFDRSGDITGILAFLFPKLGRYFGISHIVVSQAQRDFYTIQITQQWHCEHEIQQTKLTRFSAAAFLALERELLEEQPQSLDVRCLSDTQKLFFRMPEGSYSGLAFPMYDNGAYTGCMLFLCEKDEPPWQNTQESELHKVAKIIDTNIKRTRYDQASRAKSDFLSRMSHEIRTPMNAIIGMTMIARTHQDDPQALCADLDKIEQSSQYLLGLINDILDMSKIESGKISQEKKDFNLEKLIDGLGDLVHPQAAGKHIDYCVQIKLDNPLVQGDPLHLKQVLINLLGNAVKFTPAGGKVIFALTQQEGTSHYHFSVRDTGIGISPENASRIFESFEQEDDTTAQNFGGTGLGLAISMRLVRMMGGEIMLESERGEGSHFCFTLDLPQGTHQPLEKERQWEDLHFAGKRVLLAEDNELNIEIVQTLLEMRGIAVDVARNGKEAVERFEQSEPGFYDLILMDIQMPVMDGLEATKNIRRSVHVDASRIHIIAMTANAFDEDTKKSVESGMNGHLAKPIDMRAFTQALGLAFEET